MNVNFSHKEIMETINMVQSENLDVRTITMGISLRDCCHSDPKIAAEKIYDKICGRAQNLVKTGESISRDFGIPIVNKRISVTPWPWWRNLSDTDDYVPFAVPMDKAAEECGVNFIGGFSALVHKGATKGDQILINSIPQALAETNCVCSSVNIGTTKAGINMDAVYEMGKAIKKTAELTADQDELGLCQTGGIFAMSLKIIPSWQGHSTVLASRRPSSTPGVSGPAWYSMPSATTLI